MSHKSRMPLGIGLIGLGHHGRRYAKHLLHDLPEARLVAVCRRRAEKGNGLADAPAVPCYSDYHELIADSRVEAVVVVTPPTLNREVCTSVAQAKKALLVEKPLATTADDARAIARAAQASGQVMMTAQTLRFDAAVRALRARQAEAGALQYLSLASRMEPHAESEDWGFGGRGCVLEIGIHLLDLVRLLTQDEVHTVCCEMDRLAPAGPERQMLGRLTTSGGLGCLVDVSRVTLRTDRAGGTDRERRAVIGGLVWTACHTDLSPARRRRVADRDGANRDQHATRLRASCPRRLAAAHHH
ncbi:MAG: Gfo/Idh/MocA family oxidoreductase [Nitrospira sp.]